MTWTVTEKRSLNKRIRKLPENVQNILITLKKDMEINGPIRGDWPNFSALSDCRYHCHLKKGHPTYVAIWEVKNKEIRLIEVTYAGTHEKAPY
ncbi:MAG TPA: cytotoxic translational repressor of toxin-antitoxin stability system [Smithellaceae bacterium]|nr:cytotoxic translational repressor of toxin-antitoxin stability system [Smithellaceae bacterium]